MMQKLLFAVFEKSLKSWKKLQKLKKYRKEEVFGFYFLIWEDLY